MQLKTTRRHAHAQRTTTRCKARKHCADDPSAAVNCDVHCLGHCSKKKFDPMIWGFTLVVDALSKKFVDPLEFIRDYHK